MAILDTTTPGMAGAATGRPPAQGHIFVLDGVRAVAVLFVIAFHFCQFFATGPATIVERVAVWGQTGVDLFFVLSGFLITGILLDSRGSSHFLRNFYFRRILRIFPLYYLTLAGVFVVWPMLGLSAWSSWKQSIWFLVYLQNIPATFTHAPARELGHFWSLAIEEQYYLMWPLLVMVLDTRKLLKIIALAVGVSIITRVLLAPYATFFFTFARLDGLAIGSSLAIFARSHPDGLSRYVTPAKYILFTLGPMLAISQLLLSGGRVPAIQILKSTLIALCCASVILLAIENRCGKLIRSVLVSRPFRSIGKYSYGMYVFHPFLLLWLRSIGLSYNLVGLSVGIALTYMAAWISWTLMEGRFLSLKRYFEYAQAPAWGKAA